MILHFPATVSADVQDSIRLLHAAYPRFPLSPATVAFYCHALKDKPHVLRATREVAEEEDYPPPVSKILRRARTIARLKDDPRPREPEQRYAPPPGWYKETAAMIKAARSRCATSCHTLVKEPN